MPTDAKTFAGLLNERTTAFNADASLMLARMDYERVRWPTSLPASRYGSGERLTISP